MVETSILPLYTAVVGGFIAIAGCVVTHYLNQKRERTKLLIDKLEEAYLTVNSLGGWVGKQQAMLVGYRTSESNIEDPLSKVVLYLQVYLQNCDHIIEALEQSHSDIMEVIYDIAANPGGEKERIVEFSVKRDELIKHQKYALHEIRKRISNLL